jgi:hypothetical protein
MQGWQGVIHFKGAEMSFFNVCDSIDWWCVESISSISRSWVPEVWGIRIRYISITTVYSLQDIYTTLKEALYTTHLYINTQQLHNVEPYIQERQRLWDNSRWHDKAFNKYQAWYVSFATSQSPSLTRQVLKPHHISLHSRKRSRGSSQAQSTLQKSQPTPTSHGKLDQVSKIITKYNG